MVSILRNLAIVCVFSFCLVQIAQADELAELKTQIKTMQKQMEDMQEKIERLEAGISEEKEEKIGGIEKESHEQRSGLLSLTGARFELGGELEIEFVDTEKDEATSEPEPHFQIDQLYLYPKVTLVDNIILSSDIAITSSSASVEEVWAKFAGLTFNSWVEIGLNDSFIADIDRKTEAEILIETAFYRDDDIGLTFGGEPVDWLYWRLSATNGLDLDQKGPGEDNSYKIIHDDRNTSNANKRPMLGFGIGLKSALTDLGKIDILPFYYTGKLSGTDVTFLQAIPGYGTEVDDDKIRYGVNARYDFGDITVIGQYIKADDGKLDRCGWFVQPSYKIKVPGWSIFNSYDLVYRYNDLDVDLANVTASSLTWDRKQHIIGLVTDMYKGIKLKSEYSFNQENTGDGNINNDEFLTQLEIKF